MRETRRDQASAPLDPRARADFERLVDKFMQFELPGVSAKTLYQAADWFEDELPELAPDDALGGRLFAAFLRLRAKKLLETN